MYMKSLRLASALIVGATLAVSLADVLGARCKVIWAFGIPCHDVYVALVEQIKAWQTMQSCQSGGENCLYELLSATSDLIKAKHTSPTTQRVVDFQFALLPADPVCKVNGDSVSEPWGDLDNDNTNYCSLQNLVEGSGLTKVAGYKQYTSKWLCADYASANCSAA